MYSIRFLEEMNFVNLIAKNKACVFNDGSSSSDGSPRYSVDESWVSETPIGLLQPEEQRVGSSFIAVVLGT